MLGLAGRHLDILAVTDKPVRGHIIGSPLRSWPRTRPTSTLTTVSVRVDHSFILIPSRQWNFKVICLIVSLSQSSLSIIDAASTDTGSSTSTRGMPNSEQKAWYPQEVPPVPMFCVCPFPGDQRRSQVEQTGPGNRCLSIQRQVWSFCIRSPVC